MVWLLNIASFCSWLTFSLINIIGCARYAKNLTPPYFCFLFSDKSRFLVRCGGERGEHVNCKASFHGSCQQVTAALLIQLYFSLTLTRWLIWSSWLTLINWTLVWKVVLWITIAKGEELRKGEKEGQFAWKDALFNAMGPSKQSQVWYLFVPDWAAARLLLS